MVSLMLLVNLQNIQATGATVENSWETMQSLPYSLSGVAVPVGDKIYIFSNSQEYITRLFVYDTGSETLNETASMPTHRMSFGIAVVGQKIYTIGGQHYYPLPGGAVGGYPTNVTEAYDTQTGTWETKQSAIDCSSQLTANTINGKIYGVYFDGTGSTVDVYDPEADTWTRKSAIPSGVEVYEAKSCVIADSIYLLQKEDGKMFVYDVKSGNWSTAAPLPTVYSSSRMVATIGEHAPKQIYVVGGAIVYGLGEFTSVSTVFRYDPASDSWSRATDMPTARHTAAVAVVDDKIYAIGGATEQPGPEDPFWEPSQTGAVEVYTPFGYVTVQATASPSSSPESPQQPALPEATAVIAGAVIAGTVIAATTILVYRHKHLKTAKHSKPSN